MPERVLERTVPFCRIDASVNRNVQERVAGVLGMNGCRQNAVSGCSKGD